MYTRRGKHSGVLNDYLNRAYGGGLASPRLFNRKVSALVHKQNIA
jgi:hypothetical protein